MAHLSLRVLGPFRANLDGAPITAFKSNKVRALLAYLAVESGRPHSRHELAGLLWPERPEGVALANLRDALSNLRLLLQDRQTTIPLILAAEGTLQFNTDADFVLDASDFADLAARLGEPECMERAVALTRGTFLQGFYLRDSAPFEEWQLLKQEQVSRQVVVALDRLASYHEGRGAYARAETCLHRWLQLVPEDEEACQRLMRVLARAGKRGAALAQYQRLEAQLDRELRVRPSIATTALCQRIRKGEVGEPAPETPADRQGGASPGPFPFIGRARELARLEGWLDLALNGHGRVAFVTGEAGSGKTALLDEMARRAVRAHDALAVARGSCNAHAGAGDPCLPFGEILQALAGDVQAQRANGATPPEQAHRLWRLMPATARALADHGPDLVGTLVPAVSLLQRMEAFAGQYPAWLAHLQGRAGRSHPLGTQAILFAQVTAVLSDLARHTPLLLIVDDLHWADGGTAALLFHLGRRLTGSRILLVGAFRPATVGLAPATSPTAEVRQRPGTHHPLVPIIHEFGRVWGDIRVDLDRSDGRQFIDAFLDAEPNHLASGFRDRLYRHTGGNPLFVVELIRSFRQEGALRQDETGYWVEGPALTWSRLPRHIRALIGARMSALTSGDRNLLAAASVQGEDFAAEVVARVLDIDATMVTRRLSGPLSRRHHLVHAVGLDWLGGEPERAVGGAHHLSRYRFRHVLVQEYLYRGLDEIERTRLHEATGRAMESLLATDATALEAQSGQLAWHFEVAGLPLHAAQHHLRAGVRAVRMAAHDEAISHLRQGLRLLSTMPDSPQRARIELDLQLALSMPIEVTRGFLSSERAEMHERIYALCHHPALERSPQRGAALALIAHAANWAADSGRALGLGRQLLDLAQRSGNAEQLLSAHWVMGTAYALRSQMDLARQHLSQTLSCYDPVQHGSLGWVYNADPGVFSLVYRAIALWGQGYPDQANTDLSESLRMADMMGHPASQAFARLQVAFIRCLMGRDTSAAAQLEAAPPEPTRANATITAFADLLAGRRQAEETRRGRVAEPIDPLVEDGLRLARCGMETLHAEGPHIGQVQGLLVLAGSHTLAGQPGRALAATDEALATIERIGVRGYESEAHRLRGELLLELGSAQEAEACFGQAIEVARGQGTRWWELRATVHLARLWQKQGKREQARRVLAAIYGWFTEGFDLPDLCDARALLAELLVDPRREQWA